MEADVFHLGETCPDTFRIGGWVGLTGGLDAVEKKKCLWLLSVYRLAVPYPSYHTD
jgi:hypothetical protein